MKKYLTIFITMLLLIIPLKVNAEKQNEQINKTNIYLFYGRECPHCEALMEYLDELLQDKKYENVNFEKYEVWHNKENAKKADDNE